MPRGWKRAYFFDHFGRIRNDPESIFGVGDTRDKTKVWCIKCYNQQVEGRTSPNFLRDLWLDPTAGWISSHSDALALHLRSCAHQPQDVRDRAKAEHDDSLQKRRERTKRHRIAQTMQTNNEHQGSPVLDLATAVANVGFIPALEHTSLANNIPSTSSIAHHDTATNEGDIETLLNPRFGNDNIPGGGHASNVAQMFPVLDYIMESAVLYEDTIEASSSLANMSTPMTAETLHLGHHTPSYSQVWPEFPEIDGTDQYWFTSALHAPVAASDFFKPVA